MQMRVQFVREVSNPLDVDLKQLCTVMAQGGFTLQSIDVYQNAAQAQGVISAQAQQFPQAAVATQAQGAAIGGVDQAEAAERTSTRGKGKGKNTEPEKTAEPEKTPDTTASAKATTSSTERDADSKKLEVELRGILTPIATSGRGDDVNKFINDLGYAKLSAIPNAELQNVIDKAKVLFG